MGSKNIKLRGIVFILKSIWEQVPYLVYFGHYLTFIPPFLLMILVRGVVIIKNHIETWVWKLTEMKLLNFKILQNLEQPPYDENISNANDVFMYYLWNADLVLSLNSHSNALSSDRNSRFQMFFKVAVLKNFAISTRKQLRWSLYLLRLQVVRPENLLKRDF